jgi:competence protein ComEC
LWAFLLLLILPLSCRPTPPLPLRVTFLDVGQGDSTVIQSPTGRVVIVDGGGHPGASPADNGSPGNRIVVPFLQKYNMTDIDLIVPTHPDDDHVQGLIAVVERLTVRGMLDGGYFDNAASYHALRETVKHHRLPIYIARRGQTIDIGGGARLEILHPADRPILGTASPTNDNSIVLRLVYGKARVLLTGDAAMAAEDSMCASGQALTADILKAGHHGSGHSTSAAFLERVQPAVAIISCGKNNTYGHPAREVMERLEAHHVQVFRTDRDGAIEAQTDGKRWHITPTKKVPDSL